MKRQQIRHLPTRWALCVRSSAETGRIRCAYCGEELTYSEVTIDHVVATDLGGSNDPSNLVIACHSCNRAKSNRPLAAFVRSIACEKAEALTNLHAPSGVSESEWQAGYMLIASRLYREITLRVRRERERRLDRKAGRIHARLYRLMNRTVDENKALAA